MGHAETQVIDLWRMQAGNAQHEAEEFLRSQGFDDDTLTFTIAEGSDWARAIRRLDWEEGDILAIDPRRRTRSPACSWDPVRPRSSATPGPRRRRARCGHGRVSRIRLSAATNEDLPCPKRRP
jgi:hypothetical protein